MFLGNVSRETISLNVSRETFVENKKHSIIKSVLLSKERMGGLGLVASPSREIRLITDEAHHHTLSSFSRVAVRATFGRGRRRGGGVQPHFATTAPCHRQ